MKHFHMGRTGVKSFREAAASYSRINPSEEQVKEMVAAYRKAYSLGKRRE